MTGPGAGGICCQPAGYRTDHLGYGPCRWHGGNHGTVKKSVSTKRVKAAMETYGLPINIDPHTALLQEVHNTAGHVAWLRDHIRTISHQEIDNDRFSVDRALTQWTPLGVRPSVFLDLYQAERRHLLNACKVAIDAGVQERQIKLAEGQGQLLAMAITNILNDKRFNMTPLQRSVQADVIRTHLSALPIEASSTDVTNLQEDTFE